MKTFKKKWHIMITSFMVFLPLICFADVQPGEVINSENWQKAEGLLPDRILTYVKDGQMEMKIGELSYDPATWFPPAQQKAMEAGLNKGRYIIDKDQYCIVEKETGNQYPEDIVGMPFPEIDTSDPTAGQQIAYNVFNQYHQRDARGNFQLVYPLNVSDPEDIYRDLVIEAKSFWFEPDREEYDYAYISQVVYPYDLAGYGTLRHNSANPDLENQRWTVIPKMRKMRRLEGRGNDSQTSYKMQTAQDDVWALGSFLILDRARYTLVEKREALVPYWRTDPLVFDKDHKNGYLLKTPQNTPVAELGGKAEVWEGAPWAILDLVWVKQPVYVLKFFVNYKDYVYGDMVAWVNANSYTSVYKMVDDKKGLPMKNFIHVNQALKSETDDFKYMMAPIMLIGINADGWSQNTFYAGKNRASIELRKKDFKKSAFTPGGVLRFLK